MSTYKLPEPSQNPFLVPDGYFDQFTDCVMSQLPQSSGKQRAFNFHWWQSVAAVAVIAVSFISGWYLRSPLTVVAEQTEPMETNIILSDAELDATIDYEIVNNVDFSYYFTDE